MRERFYRGVLAIRGSLWRRHTVLAFIQQGGSGINTRAPARRVHVRGAPGGMKFLGSMGDAFTGGKANSYGQVTLLPEEIEDLWHTYNLIAKGDKLLATTFRKVQKQSSTGSVDSQKVKMSLAISVSRIDFDPEGGSLRVGGTIASEHEGLHLGAHHTIELELQRKYTLAKAAWDSLYLERVTQATQGAASTADVAALLMQQGLANLCLVSGGMPTPRTLSLSLL